MTHCAILHDLQNHKKHIKYDGLGHLGFMNVRGHNAEATILLLMSVRLSVYLYVRISVCQVLGEM